MLSNESPEKTTENIIASLQFCLPEKVDELKESISCLRGPMEDLESVYHNRVSYKSYMRMVNLNRMFTRFVYFHRDGDVPNAYDKLAMLRFLAYCKLMHIKNIWIHSKSVDSYPELKTKLQEAKQKILESYHLMISCVPPETRTAVVTLFGDKQIEYVDEYEFMNAFNRH